MTAPVVVIGIGNAYRRDDGVGLAVADRLARCAPSGVRVQAGVSDPSALLDAWAGAELAIVVDATVSSRAVPGRIRRFTSDAVATVRTTSSHGLDVARALGLGEALGRNPSRMALYTVDVVDVGYGIGLTAEVAAAVPEVAADVLETVASWTRRRIPRNIPRVISAVTGEASSAITTSPGWRSATRVRTRSRQRSPE
jgi:hydrogenase maturation protease